MKTISKTDWEKITTQKMAIRMAPSSSDLNGHAYGLYEPAPINRSNIMASLNRPDNWYDRLYNTMLFITDYAREKDKFVPWFLLLIKGTAQYDHHWFPIRDGRGRGDGLSMPRVNLRLANATPSVVSYYLMEDLAVNNMPENAKIECFCDLVITKITAARLGT